MKCKVFFHVLLAILLTILLGAYAMAETGSPAALIKSEEIKLYHNNTYTGDTIVVGRGRQNYPYFTAPEDGFTSVKLNLQNQWGAARGQASEGTDKVWDTIYVRICTPMMVTGFTAPAKSISPILSGLTWTSTRPMRLSWNWRATTRSTSTTTTAPGKATRITSTASSRAPRRRIPGQTPMRQPRRRPCLSILPASRLLRSACMLTTHTSTEPSSLDAARNITNAGSDTQVKLVFGMPQEDATVIINPVKK